MADESKEKTTGAPQSSPAQPESAYRPDPSDFDVQISPQTEGGIYDELPEYVRHRPPSENDVQQAAYGNTPIGIGDIATAPLEVMSASDVYRGYRMVKDVADPFVNMTAASGAMPVAAFSKEYYLYKTDHKEAAEAIKDNGGTYLLSDEGRVNLKGKTNTQIVTDAKKQTQVYLELHGIFLGKASDAKIQRAIESGKFGKKILSPAEISVLQEYYNLSKAENMRDKASGYAKGAGKSVENLGKRSFRGSEAMQGKNIAGRAAGIPSSMVRGAYYGTTRAGQAVRALRDKRLAGKANRESGKAAKAGLRGDSSSQAMHSKKAETLRERLQTRKQASANRIRRRNRYEGKIKKFRKRGTLGKASVIGKKSVSVIGKGANKLFKLDQTKLYKKMSEVNHARRIRKLQKTTNKTASRAGKIFRRLRKPFKFLPRILRGPLVFILCGILLLSLFIGVAGVFSAIASWRPSIADSDDGKEEASPNTYAQQAVNAMFDVQKASSVGYASSGSGKIDNLSALNNIALLQATLDGQPLDKAQIAGKIDKFKTEHEFREAEDVKKYDFFTGYERPERFDVPEAERANPITIYYHDGNDVDEQIIYPNASVPQYLGDVSFRRSSQHLSGWKTTTSLGTISQVYAKVTPMLLRSLSKENHFYAVWEENGPKTISNYTDERYIGEITLPTEEEVTDTLSVFLPESAITIRYQYTEDGEVRTTEDYSDVAASQKTLYKVILGAVTVAFDNNVTIFNKNLMIKTCEAMMKHALQAGSGYRVDYKTVLLSGTADTDNGVVWEAEDGHEAHADNARLIAEITVYLNCSAESVLKEFGDITANWINSQREEDDDELTYFEGWNEDTIDLVKEYASLDDDEFKELFGITNFPSIGRVGGTSAAVAAWISEIAEADGYTISSARINLLKCALEDVGKYSYSYGGGHTSTPPIDAPAIDCSAFVSLELYRSGVDSAWNPRATGTLMSSYLATSASERRPGDIMVRHLSSKKTDHVVIYAGWFTYNGKYGEYVVHCTTGGGANGSCISPYSWYAGYEHYRAIDKVFVSEAECKSYLQDLKTGGGSGSIPEIYNGYEVGTKNCYTYTMYREGGWYIGGKIVGVGEGHGQRRIWQTWKNHGAVYTDNVATIDGMYLIACVEETFGACGDWITWYFDDGSTLETIVADAKSPGDSNYTIWGHITGNVINVIEFEINLPVHPGTSSCIPQVNNRRAVGWENHGSMY